MTTFKKLRELNPGEVSVARYVKPSEALAKVLLAAIEHSTDLPGGAWLLSVNIAIRVDCVLPREMT